MAKRQGTSATTRRRSNTAIDFQQILENSQIRVIVANRNLEIIYMNPASRSTLRDMQHLLPVAVDDILGKPIDIFHKNPEHQRRFLADPSTSHTKPAFSSARKSCC